MKLTLVLDPRFPGGTSSAVAQEILALAPFFDLSVVGLQTKHFRGTEANPKILAALEQVGLPFQWAGHSVAADVIVFHNPAALKFDTDLPTRFLAEQFYVVAHENFLRPNGTPGFDVAKTLNLLDAATIAQHLRIAPVSGYNRSTVEGWLTQLKSSDTPWQVTPFNWFNICDFAQQPPNPAPSDRRGRLSRVGYEKFPSRAIMEVLFPNTAIANVILGGDTLMNDRLPPPKHWEIHKFGALELPAFFEKLDFFVYYTHPELRESFGRVIPEAIAAGKMVITDPGTGQTFGPAVITASPEDASSIISHYCAQPRAYEAFVRKAQAWLTRFSSQTFAQQIQTELGKLKGKPGALL